MAHWLKLTESDLLGLLSLIQQNHHQFPKEDYILIFLYSDSYEKY